VNRVGKQHDAKDKPGSCLADEYFCLAAGVIGRRSEVVQDNRRGSSEGDKHQHGRGGHKDFGDRAGSSL
jgi:hypothetical protein